MQTGAAIIPAYTFGTNQMFYRSGWGALALSLSLTLTLALALSLTLALLTPAFLSPALALALSLTSALTPTQP